MTEFTSHGPVEIRVPPDPSLSRVLRLAASGIASLTTFTVDEIEDIKVAVSEALLALVEHGGGKPVDIRLLCDDHRFIVEASTAVDEFDVDHVDLQMCRTVLQGVCTSHLIEATEGHARIRATVAHAITE
jgi:anti-sigma regulatory factor (Ser/Thr protein kinase)